MAYYNKKIIYLSYMKWEEKVSNAGFIKLEQFDSEVRVEVNVKGLPLAITERADVLFVGENGTSEKIGEIVVRGGGGTYVHNTLEVAKIVNTGAIRIYLSEGRKVEGQIKDIEAPKNPIQKEQTMKMEKNRDEKNGDEKLKIENVKRENADKEMKAEEIKMEYKETMVDLEQVILTDKWKQLMQLYPVVHPYEDNREYISIEPKDFVIMTGNYQHLANNSFLLHGFYNYRYIILGKEIVEMVSDEGKREEAEVFYLGVPGVYYEREKMVAIMFGFEAFDCVGGITQQGKFGYYLRKVEI